MGRGRGGGGGGEGGRGRVTYVETCDQTIVIL